MRRLRKTVSFRRFSWPLGFYRVSGNSMQPVLYPGQLLVGWRWGRPKTGRVAVVRRHLPLVKRISHVGPEGVWLLGDNPAASTDSRSFGYVDPSSVEAVVVWPLQNGL